MTRRTAIGAGLAGALLASGALVAWLVVPAVVRDEAAERIGRRTGLRCVVGGADVVGDVVLRDVALHDSAGTLVARLDAVLLGASVFGLGLDGPSAIDSLVIRGGEVRVDLSTAELGAFASSGEVSAESSAGAAERRLPSVRVEDVAVTVRDELGELFAARSTTVAYAAGSVEISAAEVAIASGSPESIAVAAVHLTGSVDRRAIDTLEARGVRVALADHEPGEAGILARVRAVSARASAGGTPSGPSLPAASPTPLRFLGPEFQASVTDVAVRRRGPGGERDVLTGLDLEVERTGADVLHTQGHGSPDGGGRLQWDLELAPVALRAEGAIELREVSMAVIEPFLPDALPLHRPEDARIGGELRIEGQGDALQARGRLTVHDLALSSTRIAPQPIAGIAFSLEGEATFFPEERRLEIARLHVLTGAARLQVGGAIEWASDHYLFDLEATLPMTACNDAIGAIPPDLLQELASLSLGGTLGGRAQMRVDSRDLDSTILTFRVADGCRFEMVPAAADLSRFERPFVHRVEEPDGTVFEMETGPGTEAWTPITAISPFMLQAVLGHEDGGFWSHSGFSPFSIREALVRNLRAGRYVMGASTISMQLVKNVFLRREKTLARKVQEVLLTWWIESAWPKERILELYLNVIEYGPGVYGIRNAALHYFGVEPADLSPAQAAYLATILPSPKLYRSHRESGVLPVGWVPRLTRFLRLLGERGRFDAIAVDEGVRELDGFRFHREGDPPAMPRIFEGRATALPFAASTDSSEAAWNEALDGELVEGGEDGYE